MKRKECEVLILKINRAFKINITEKDSTYRLIWFRWYIINKYKDFDYSVCVMPLKTSTQSLINSRKALKKVINRKEFSDITEIIETLSVEKYKKFLEEFSRKKYYNSKIEKKPLSKRPNISDIKIREQLNKNLKSKLWDKDFKNYTDNDWIELLNY